MVHSGLESWSFLRAYMCIHAATRGLVSLVRGIFSHEDSHPGNATDHWGLGSVSHTVWLLEVSESLRAYMCVHMQRRRVWVSQCLGLMAVPCYPRNVRSGTYVAGTLTGQPPSGRFHSHYPLNVRSSDQRVFLPEPPSGRFHSSHPRNVRRGATVHSGCTSGPVSSPSANSTASSTPLPAGCICSRAHIGGHACTHACSYAA